MPLTLAHPAAILPLRRLGLPVSALVLGTMIPDVPVFLDRYGLYDITHSWWGVVTVDVVGVVVGLALWFAVLRDPLVDLCPAWVRDRLQPRARLDRRAWRLVPLAGAIGAATHVAWDSFTHPDTWGTEQVPWLQQEHLGLAGHVWAQNVSGVLGLAVVVVAAAEHLRGLPVVRTTTSPRALAAWALPAAVAGALVAGLAVALTRIPSGFLVMAFDGVVTSIVVGVLLAGVLAGAWQTQVRRSGR